MAEYIPVIDICKDNFIYKYLREKVKNRGENDELKMFECKRQHRNIVTIYKLT